MARLPKAIIKKYGITKKAWAVYRGRSRTASPRRKTKVAAKRTRRRRAYSRAKRYAGRAQSPLIGHLMFSGGAFAGEKLTDEHIRPWMGRNKYLANSPVGQAAVLLGGSYLLKRFTNRRGVKNIGTGAAAYMAAKGMGMLWQTFKGSNGG